LLARLGEVPKNALDASLDAAWHPAAPPHANFSAILLHVRHQHDPARHLLRA
jgi:hypothetical protein